MTKKYVYSNVPIGEKSMCLNIAFTIRPIRMNDKSIILYDGFTIEGIEDFKAFQSLEVFINNKLVSRFGFIEYYNVDFINNIIGSNYIIINNYVDNITFKFHRNLKEYDIRGFKMSYNIHTKEDKTTYLMFEHVNETLKSMEKGIKHEFNWIDIYNDYIKYIDYISLIFLDRNTNEIITELPEGNGNKKLKHIFMIKTPKGLAENDYKFSIGLDDNLTLKQLNEIILKGIYDVDNIFITFDKDKIEDETDYFIMLCKYA